MKNIRFKISVAFLGLILAACSNNKEAKLYYSTGELKAKGQEINERKQGVWSVYDKQGNMVKKLYFSNDSLNFRETYIDNKLAISEELMDSIRDGELKLYFENGSLKELYTYSQGSPEGEVQLYFDNYNKKVQYNMEDEFQLDYVQYHKNGAIFIKADTFGFGIMHFYDTLGNKYMDVEFENELPLDTLKIY